RVKPIPSPPISTRAWARPAIFLQGMAASASSEPCMRVFINCPPLPPSNLMTKSSPYSNRQSAPPSFGMGVVSSRTWRFIRVSVFGALSVDVQVPGFLADQQRDQCEPGHRCQIDTDQQRAAITDTPQPDGDERCN